MFDLVLKGGRVIDPAQGVDDRLDVAFAASGFAPMKMALGHAELPASKI